MAGVSLRAKATLAASFVFAGGMIAFVHVNQRDERQVRRNHERKRTPWSLLEAACEDEGETVKRIALCHTPLPSLDRLKGVAHSVVYCSTQQGSPRRRRPRHGEAGTEAPQPHGAGPAAGATQAARGCRREMAAPNSQS